MSVLNPVEICRGSVMRKQKKIIEVFFSTQLKFIFISSGPKNLTQVINTLFVVGFEDV